MKDNSGGSGHAHKRPDHEKFFPTKMRITVIQVSAGSKYDPGLVPNLPPKAAAGSGKQSNAIGETRNRDEASACCEPVK